MFHHVLVDFPPLSAHRDDGSESVRFDPSLMSVPISALWSG